MPTGVKCRLATRTGRRIWGIGTAVTHASVTGRRVLQGSTYTELTLGGSDRPAPWSHYLSRPGSFDVPGKGNWGDIRDGFLGQEPQDTLDLGAISERMMDGIQSRPDLDREPPFRARRTALRWTLEDLAEDPPWAHFTIASPTLRTLQLAVKADTEKVLQLCEDLALHDWLLTTLLDLIERGQRKAGQLAEMVESLRPAVEHLLHLWLPGARVDESLLPFWDGFERRPGFSRQWEVSVNQIRDQIAVTTAGLLSPASAGIRRQGTSGTGWSVGTTTDE